MRIQNWTCRGKPQDRKKIERGGGTSVQKGTRPCIIVSNDIGNTYAPIVEIVYMTTADKPNIPTHFVTESAPRRSVVLCEQVMTVPKKDLREFYGKLTMKEKVQLDRCLRISLGL